MSYLSILDPHLMTLKCHNGHTMKWLYALPTGKGSDAHYHVIFKCFQCGATTTLEAFEVVFTDEQDRLDYGPLG